MALRCARSSALSILGSALPSSALLPRGFFAGEKVPKADEGAVLALKLSVFMSSPGQFIRNSPLLGKDQRPLIRLRHLLPPAEKRGGEKDARRTL